MLFINYGFAWWNSKSKWIKGAIYLGVFITLMFSIMATVIINFSDSRAFKIAVKELSSNTTVSEEFGLKPQYSFDYSNGFTIADNGGTGEADFVIQILGNEQTGLAYVSMEKSAGMWVINEMNLFIPDKDPIVITNINNT